MPAYCTPCGRSFNAQADLDQHLRKSAAHQISAQRPPLVQTPLRAKVPTVKAKQKKQPYPNPQTRTLRKQGQPPNAVASGSQAPQILTPINCIVPQGVNSRWSAILGCEYTTALNALSEHRHSLKELEKNGYLSNPYNPLDYVNSRKCTRCNSQEKKVLERNIAECTFHPKKRNKRNRNKPYSCCGTDGRGCKILPTHDFQLSLRALKHKEFLPTPTASAEKPRFRAVTLDCEMVGVAGGANEAVFLCAADYLSGAILLSRYIAPKGKIIQMRASIHGISKSTLQTAISQGQTLSGWEGAREELWKYIDDSTILIGHALEHDLDALRIIHPSIVDSAVLARSAVGIQRIRWGLKTLCPELLNLEIRKNKGGIHDCQEDVLATRELVLFCTQKKEAFQSWAETKRAHEMRLEKEREIARKKKENEKKLKYATHFGGETRGTSSNHTYLDSDDEDIEIMRWSDIAEDLGWPHPDTGYDPWSD